MGKYANRYWEIGEKNKFGKECYLLHFTEFIDDEVILGFVQDEEDENSYVYTSKLLGVEDDIITAEDVEDAKEIFESMIVNHLESEISDLQMTIDKFEEKEE